MIKVKIKMRANKTIIVATDASPGKERTGFAYCIDDGSGEVNRQAWYRNESISSSDAEIEAAMDALYVIEKKRYPRGTEVHFYCDNMTVVDILNTAHTKIKTQARFAKYIAIVRTANKHLNIKAEHIKAHTGVYETTAEQLNAWCDWNSRAMQRHQRLHVRSK